MTNKKSFLRTWGGSLAWGAFLLCALLFTEATKRFGEELIHIAPFAAVVFLGYCARQLERIRELLEDRLQPRDRWQ